MRRNNLRRRKPRRRKLKGWKEHVASNGLTHTKIIEYSRKVLKRAGTMWKCGITFAELSTANTEIPDVLGFQSDGSALIEAKASRSDFLSDKKKKFRKYPQIGMGNYRFYACPKGIIKKEELPDKWGLIYVSEKGRSTLVVKPERQECNLRAENTYMYSVLRRIIIYNKTKEIENFIKKYSDYADRQKNI